VDFLSKDLQAYIEAKTTQENPLLQKLNRETNANVLMSRMLSGHLQGRVLSILSHMIKPANILEIGTYTGYSAICLAEGLRPGGKLYTIDVNQELEGMTRQYLSQAGLDEIVQYIVGNAVEIIPSLDIEFDLVFIDADKSNYCKYFDLVIDKVVPNGFIIADNVLWSGKILEKGKKDEDAQGIIDFNDKVHLDKRVDNVLFPIRDGLMVLRKL